jgi:hypothetical protein
MTSIKSSVDEFVDDRPFCEDCRGYTCGGLGAYEPVCCCDSDEDEEEYICDCSVCGERLYACGSVELAEDADGGGCCAECAPAEECKDMCCECGKFKDTGSVCDCGGGHREICDECKENKPSIFERLALPPTEEFELLSPDEQELQLLKFSAELATATDAEWATALEAVAAVKIDATVARARACAEARGEVRHGEFTAKAKKTIKLKLKKKKPIKLKLKLKKEC